MITESPHMSSREDTRSRESIGGHTILWFVDADHVDGDIIVELDDASRAHILIALAAGRDSGSLHLSCRADDGGETEDLYGYWDKAIRA